MSVIDILSENKGAFLTGAQVTASLFFLSLSIGTVFGIFVSILAIYLGDGFKRVPDFIALCFAAIPPIVTLYWVHYPMQSLLGLDFPPFYSALITLSAINTLAIYRIVSDANGDFPRHYLDAALVCGLTPMESIRQIRIPILLRMCLPRWLDQQVVILHSTIFASLISVGELFRVAQRINSQIYEPISIYTAMAFLFLVSTAPVLALSRRLKTHWFPNLSEK
jgi:polar amino acid transport system permease protein